MTKPLTVPPPGFEKLSIQEKIDYVQSLWDHIAADADTASLTEWQKMTLERRLQDFERDPDAGVDWERVRDRLRNKLTGGGG